MGQAKYLGNFEKAIGMPSQLCKQFGTTVQRQSNLWLKNKKRRRSGPLGKENNRGGV
jgi:hypothetical protein